jgi:hypothetical protein
MRLLYEEMMDGNVTLKEACAARVRRELPWQ